MACYCKFVAVLSFPNELIQRKSIHQLMYGNFVKYESVLASYILAFCPLGLGSFGFFAYYNGMTYLLDPITGDELKILLHVYESFSSSR